jgi:hypothetical protein
MLPYRGPPKESSKGKYTIAIIFGLIAILLFIIYMNIEMECAKAISEDCLEWHINLGGRTIGKMIGKAPAFG